MYQALIRTGIVQTIATAVITLKIHFPLSKQALAKQHITRRHRLVIVAAAAAAAGKYTHGVPMLLCLQISIGHINL